MMNQWPLQSDRSKFYGNPMGPHGQVSLTWEAANLVYITTPFKMTYAGKPVKQFLIHMKCKDSLQRIFGKLAQYGQLQLDTWGVTTFGGCFNYRLTRGSNTLSSHAWGCAIDLAPQKFPMGQSKNRFAWQVVKEFEAEGWINLQNDPMHFQASRLA